jgi:PIN domain nuclease of toxin-antitoxin system
MSDKRYMLDASAVLAMMLGEDGGDRGTGPTEP